MPEAGSVSDKVRDNGPDSFEAVAVPSPEETAAALLRAEAAWRAECAQRLAFGLPAKARPW